MRLEISEDICQRLEISDELHMRFEMVGEIIHMRLEVRDELYHVFKLFIRWHCLQGRKQGLSPVLQVL